MLRIAQSDIIKAWCNNHDGIGLGADFLASHCEQGWLPILLVHDNLVGYALAQCNCEVGPKWLVFTANA